MGQGYACYTRDVRRCEHSGRDMTKHGFQSQIAFNSWRLTVTSQSQGMAKWDTECLVSWCNQNDRWGHQDTS